MRCEEAEHYFAEYLAGTLPADSSLLKHLEVCPRCREEVEELQGIWNGLDGVAVPRAPSIMQTGLLAALAEAKLEIKQPISIRRKPMQFILKPVLLVVMAIGGAFFLGHSFVQPPHESAVGFELPNGSPSEGHFRGAATVPLTLVEFGDYECPACATYNPIVNEVLQRYGDKVRLEYRQFPLTVIHHHAMPAALAAEAAGEQGHYWEMHDLLFSSQQRWAHAENAEAEFATLAATIGLDSDQFIRTLRDPKLQQRITDDLAAARAANVNATPTFFLNGRRIEQAPTTVEGFLALIDAELPQKK